MKNKWSFRVWGFFTVVFITSALLWAPVLISGRGIASPMNMVLMVLIAFVPSITGIIFTYITKDKQGRRDFWRRAIRWPRISRLMTMAFLLLFPAINFAAFALSTLWSGGTISFAYAKALLSNMPLLLQFLVIEITLGALSEELGWRGYLLDELQFRWSALGSALVLGILWGLWHTPAFLTPGLAQHEMGGVFSVPYLAFVMGAVLASVLQTWVYNNTGRSILVAGFLMHFLTNVSMTLLNGTFDGFAAPDGYWAISTGIYLLVTTVIVAAWGPKTMTRLPVRNRVERDVQLVS